MAFTFSKEISLSKLSLIDWREVSGQRWDAKFNSILRTSFYDRFTGKQLSKLKHLISEGSYGVLPPGDSYSTNNPVRLIRATDMSTNLCIDYSNAVRVDQEYYDKNPRCRLSKDDILLAVKGATIASDKCVSYIESDVDQTIVNGSIFRLRANPEIHPKFLAYMLDLNITKTQMRLSCIANNAVEYLDKATINRFLVYTPTREKQEDIIFWLNEVYKERYLKESEAQHLLDSIDAYLLQELGITLPPDGSNSIHDRMFKRDWSEIAGGRWDSPSNSTSFSFTESRYPILSFSKATKINPPTRTSSIDKTAQVSFVPMEAISDELGNVASAYTRPISEKTGYTLFQEGDIIWAKITPCMQNGKSAVVTGLVNGIGFGSTEFHVFRPTSLVRAEFVHAIVRLRALRFQATRWFSGSAGQQRVDATFFRKLSIPVPPLDIQDTIIHEIESLRTKAMQLRLQAVEIVQNAKAEVENLIIGG